MSASAIRRVFLLVVVLGALAALYFWQIRPSADVRVTGQSVALSTEKSTYVPGETVPFSLQNTGSDPIELVATGPYAVFAGSSKSATYQAMQAETLAPSAAKSWTWDQKDAKGQPVADGVYTVEVAYRLKGELKSVRVEFTVKTPTPTTAVNDTVSMTFDGSAAGTDLPQDATLPVRITSANGAPAKIFSNPGACGTGSTSEASSQPNFAVGNPSPASVLTLEARGDSAFKSVTMKLISVGSAGVAIRVTDQAGATLKEDKVVNADSPQGCGKQNTFTYTVTETGKFIGKITLTPNGDGFGVDDVAFSTGDVVSVSTTTVPTPTPTPTVTPATTPTTTSTPTVAPGTAATPTATTAAAAGDVTTYSFDSQPSAKNLDQPTYTAQGVLVASNPGRAAYVVANGKPCTQAGITHPKQMIIGKNNAQDAPSLSDPINLYPRQTGKVASKATVDVLVAGNAPVTVTFFDTSGNPLVAKALDVAEGDCNTLRTASHESAGGIGQINVAGGGIADSSGAGVPTGNRAVFGVGRFSLTWAGASTVPTSTTTATTPSAPETSVTNQISNNGTTITTGTPSRQWQIQLGKTSLTEGETFTAKIVNTGKQAINTSYAGVTATCVVSGWRVRNTPFGSNSLAPGQALTVSFPGVHCGKNNTQQKLEVYSQSGPGPLFTTYEVKKKPKPWFCSAPGMETSWACR